MTNSLPISDELWSQVPPEAQAALAALFLGMQQRIRYLETRANDLEARLKLNSTNSHMPPLVRLHRSQAKAAGPSHRQETRRSA